MSETTPEIIDEPNEELETQTSTDDAPTVTPEPETTSADVTLSDLAARLDSLPDRLATSLVAAFGAAQTTEVISEPASDEKTPVEVIAEPPVEVAKDEAPTEDHWYFRPLFPFGRK